MNQIVEGLNPAQREAVETLEGPLLILAGAGSGKTKTLTHRIANLIAHGVRPYDILAVTFTNKAANEMRGRLWALLKATNSIQDWGESDSNPPRSFMPFMGTFHGIAVRVLRQEADIIGLDRNFVIYDADLGEGHIHSCFLKNSRHYFIHAFSKILNRLSYQVLQDRCG